MNERVKNKKKKVKENNEWENEWMRGVNKRERESSNDSLHFIRLFDSSFFSRRTHLLILFSDRNKEEILKRGSEIAAIDQIAFLSLPSIAPLHVYSFTSNRFALLQSSRCSSSVIFLFLFSPSFLFLFVSFSSSLSSDEGEKERMERIMARCSDRTIWRFIAIVRYVNCSKILSPFLRE